MLTDLLIQIQYRTEASSSWRLKVLSVTCSDLACDYEEVQVSLGEFRCEPDGELALASLFGNAGNAVLFCASDDTNGRTLTMGFIRLSPPPLISSLQGLMIVEGVVEAEASLLHLGIAWRNISADATQDLDGDDIVDIVLATRDSVVILYITSIDGEEIDVGASSVVMRSDSRSSPFSVAALGDVNGDGVGDLLVGDTTGRIISVLTSLDPRGESTTFTSGVFDPGPDLSISDAGEFGFLGGLRAKDPSNTQELQAAVLFIADPSVSVLCEGDQFQRKGEIYVTTVEVAGAGHVSPRLPSNCVSEEKTVNLCCGGVTKQQYYYYEVVKSGMLGGAMCPTLTYDRNCSGCGE